MARARAVRRRLSMTPLIDVIFLLLLFFMLTSTFSRFSEVELSAAGAGGPSEATTPPLFVQLADQSMTLNGEALSLAALPAAIAVTVGEETPQPVIVSLRPDVTSQRLTDLLVVLRDLPDLTVTVLGAG